MIPLPDQYTDQNELGALCEMLGPAGIAFLDEQLLKSAVNAGQGMKDLISQSQDQFEKLRGFWEDESRVGEIKKLKCMKLLANKSSHEGIQRQSNRVWLDYRIQKAPVCSISTRDYSKMPSAVHDNREFKQVLEPTATTTPPPR
jgi:hypothetical protein